MSEPVRIDLERLLAQTTWVRRLALSLSRDEASAEDLAQDAFAVALTRPPRHVTSDGALRAWFATVTRNLAITRARGESRRSLREHAAAQPELERSQERLRELEELRGELVRHVLALPEEAQQVVLLHYFEELDSAEIARRLGAPDSTIRNRLRRALVELRERLERQHGTDWRNMCLFVLPSTGTKVAAGTGAIAAASGLWIGGGAVVVLALALLLTWELRPAERLESTDGAALVALAAVESKPESPAAPEQLAPASERAPESLVVAPKPFLLFGQVLDAQQKPLEAASVSLTDDRNQSKSSQNSPGGWYSFTALEPGLYDARIEAEGGAPLVTRLDLRTAAGDTRRDFTLGAVTYVQVRLLRSDGTRWPAADLQRRFEKEFQLCVVATAEAPGKTLGPRTWGDYSNYGVGRYRSPAGRSSTHMDAGSSGVLEVFSPLPVFASLCQAQRVLESKVVDASTHSLDFLLDENFVHGLAASAVGIVIDERSGSPAAGIEVTLNPSWRSGDSSKSDEQGRVVLQDLFTGTLDLSIGGAFGGIGGISRQIEITPGTQHDLGSLPWLPARRLRAHVVDAAGNPASARIQLALDDRGLDASWRAPRMSGDSDTAGNFEWQSGPGFATTIIATRKSPSIEAGAVTLARGAEGPAEIHMLPARIVGIRASVGRGIQVRIRVTDSQGTPWAEAGNGQSLTLPDGEYSFSVWESGVKLHESSARVDADTRTIELNF